MSIITRYVLSELAKVFAMSLGALTVLMMLVGVLREALDQNLPLGPIVRIMPYILPEALRVTIPVALLFSVTVIYGRFAGNNEMTAIKAAGISPMVMIWPTLIVAVVASIGTVWLNDLAVSWGRLGVQRVVMESVDDIVYAMLKSKGGYNTEDFSITVGGVDGRRLLGPVVISLSKEDTYVRAAEAELEVDVHHNRLFVMLRESIITAPGKRLKQPGELRQEIPLGNVSRAKRLGSHPSSMRLSEIPDAIVRTGESCQEREDQMAVMAAYEMLTGDYEALADESWQRRKRSLDEQHGHLSRLRAEPHRRLSAGFACLCFAMLGAPVALRMSKSDMVTTFFVCFLPILVVYYPLFAYGLEGAKNGSLPPWGVWGANVVIALAGLVVLRKVMRY